jgi:hypothetical protein
VRDLYHVIGLVFRYHLLEIVLWTYIK